MKKDLAEDLAPCHPIGSCHIVFPVRNGASTRLFLTEEFFAQPATTPQDPLVLSAKARIGPQEGFFTIIADGCSITTQAVNAGGLLQRVRVETPSYVLATTKVVYNNGCVTVSATQTST